MVASKKKIAKAQPKPAQTKQRKALAAAVDAVGSQGKFAKKIGCSQQSVSAWLKGDTPRPVHQRAMKKAFNIPEPW